jgi:hypothetical protein
MAVGRVDDERVDLGLDERRGALDGVRPDPDRGGDAQPAALVLGRERIRLALRDVLDGDEPLEAPLEVDDRELLDAVAAENRLRLLEGRPDRGGDEPLLVIASATRIVEGTPKRRSRFVRMPTSRSSSSVIGIPETR